MLKKKLTRKFTLILSGIFVLVCFASLITIAYAWFTYNDKPVIDASVFGIGLNEHNGYEFTKFDDQAIADDEFIIYPGDILTFDIESLTDNNVFGLQINVRPLIGQAFFDKFLSRQDLISGHYQIERSIDAGLSQPVLNYSDFDIDIYLKQQNILSEDAQQIKADFFKAIVDNNSICSAFTLKVIRIGDTNCNIELNTNDVDDLLVRRYYLDGYDDIPNGTIIKLQIQYGYNNFLPSVSYDFGQGIANYRSLNYNCFIGQHINLNLLNVRVH